MREEHLERLRALCDLSVGLVEEAAVLKDAYHVADVVAQPAVLLLRHPGLYGLEI